MHVREGFFCRCSSSAVCAGCKELVFALQRDLPSPITSCQAELRQYTADIKYLVDKFLQTLGQTHAISAACTVHLARLYFELDDCDAAMVNYELALWLYEGDARLRAATEPGALGEHAGALAALYRQKADFINEKRALLRALSFRRESPGPLHELTIEVECRLGICLHNLEDFDGAEAYFMAALTHEREAGCEGRIGGRCYELPVVPKLNILSNRHTKAGRLQRALHISQMALPIAERVCVDCFERGDVETVVIGIAFVCISQGDYSAAVAAAERLVSETERRLGPTHLRVGSALALFARLHLDSNAPGLAEPSARRAWEILEAALQLDPACPKLGCYLSTLWTAFRKAPHAEPAKAFFKARAAAICPISTRDRN
eukprot:tig00000670_g3030.t1